MDLNKDTRYFRTTSFYAAAFLFAMDQVLSDIDKSVDPRKAQFVFLDSPELQDLLQAFNFAQDNSPGVMVDSRKFVVAIKSLKEKLYQGDI